MSIKHLQDTYETVKLYHVIAVTADERGSFCGTVGYYTSWGAAEHAAAVSESAPYTSIREVPGLRVGSCFFHLKEPQAVDVDKPVEENEAKARREHALSKLTHAEKIALGLA